MGRRLAASVHLRDPETGMSVSFPAGSEPPAWAAEQITNPAAWGEAEPVSDEWEQAQPTRVEGAPADGDVGDVTEEGNAKPASSPDDVVQVIHEDQDEGKTASRRSSRRK